MWFDERRDILMKKSYVKKVFLLPLVVFCMIGTGITLPSSIAEATPQFLDNEQIVEYPIARAAWYLDGNKNCIAVGPGTFFNSTKDDVADVHLKTSAYIFRDSVKTVNMENGKIGILAKQVRHPRPILVVYEPKNAAGTYRARFYIIDRNGNVLPDAEANKIVLPSDSGSGNEIKPFPNSRKGNMTRSRIAEMLYFIAFGKQYYGDLDPYQYRTYGGEVVGYIEVYNPYTEDVYERCKGL